MSGRNLTIGVLVAWLLAMVAMAGAAQLSGKPPAPAAQAVQKPTERTEHCVNDACHTSVLGHKHMHGPAAQQKCNACHLEDEPREHRFKYPGKQEELCNDCHTLTHRTVVHAPIKQGQCTGCHNPHGSSHRLMLVEDPTRGLCLSCHKQDFADKKHVHGPVSAGACILCHEPHSSWQPKLLTEPPDKLCISCHSEISPKGDAARHVHAPVKDANCTGCHDAHASNFRFHLRQDGVELCMSCHKDTGEHMAASKVVHGAVKLEAGCASCHTPHFSHLPKLQKASQPESCLGCHDKPMQTADGRGLTDIATLLKNNSEHHGPIRDGACTACHEPHAGNNFRMLLAEYPPDFYAPFKIDNYALCFKCHIPELVQKERGTGLTRFRDGDVNLHWLHVNREKGRTCRACHEVHASRNPFHIRDSVPFGTKSWMLELNYRQSDAGGTCSPGCHAPKNYDRGPEPAATRKPEAEHAPKAATTTSIR
jgi:predicted CXXCH cytochrome family protein